jgi:hypothetical protein
LNPWRSRAAERKFWDMIWFLEFMPKSIRRRSRRRLGEIIWRGWIDVDGDSEKIHITVRRNGRLPKGGYRLYAQGKYLGESFTVEDRGLGLEPLKEIVKEQLRKKREKKQGRSTGT